MKTVQTYPLMSMKELTVSEVFVDLSKFQSLGSACHVSPILGWL